MHNHEIRPGKQLKVNISVANVRLFVGNIPKNKSKEEIQEEFAKKTGESVYDLKRCGKNVIKGKVTCQMFGLFPPEFQKLKISS